MQSAKSANILQMDDNDQVMCWLETHSSYVNMSNVRLITNRYREKDGKDSAGPNLIKSVRADPRYKAVPVLLYVGSRKTAAEFEDRANNVFVHDSGSVALSFARFDLDFLHPPKSSK